ncbi:CoA transferase [Arthrobacter sp. TMT4-20]
MPEINSPAPSGPQPSSVGKTPRQTALLPNTLKVVELGETVATALCGRFLLKLGAEVTRVLPTDTSSGIIGLGPTAGVGERPAITEWLNPGKVLTELDFADTHDRQRLEQVLREADVVLVAGTSRQWDQIGLSIDEIDELAHHAVIGRITPWGDSGPYSELLGGELQYQAVSGFMRLMGESDQEPVRLGGYPMQAIAGLLALDGVMIGLFARESTGEGSRFSTSEFEASAHAEWKIATTVQAGFPKEVRGEDKGSVVVRCRDGHFALFYIPSNWDAVKAVIGDPRLDDESFATPRSRELNRIRLIEVIEETTISMSKIDLYYATQRHNIPAGYVATMTDLLSSPQYISRNFFERVDGDDARPGVIPNVPWQVFTSDDYLSTKDRQEEVQA